MVELGGKFNGKRIRGIALAAALLSLCVSGAIARQTPAAAATKRSRLRRLRLPKLRNRCICWSAARS